MLALLAERGDYGYGLEKRLRERLGRGSSQKGVYKALDYLEKGGLVERTGEKQFGRTARGHPRIMYALTDEGLSAYRDWMAQPDRVEEGFAPYEEIQLRLVLAGLAGPEDFQILQGAVQQEIRQCVARLREIARPSLAEVTDEALPWTEAAELLAGDAEALHLEAYVQWLHTANAVIRHRLGGKEG